MQNTLYNIKQIIYVIRMYAENLHRRTKNTMTIVYIHVESNTLNLNILYIEQIQFNNIKSIPNIRKYKMKQQ